MSEPHQLQYAKPIRWHRLRRHYKWAIAIAALVAVLIGVRYGPQWASQFKVLARQRECLTFTRPAGFLVYEEWVGPEGPSTQPSPELILGDGSANLGATAWHYIAPPWAKFEPHVRGTPFRLASQTATVFLHERVSRSGNRRLVVVQCNPAALETNGLEAWFYRRSVVIVPADLDSPPMKVPVSRDYGPDAETKIPSAYTIRIFAGQPDPNDASRFTIRYEVAGQSGEVEGRLGDDDRLRFRVISGPAMAQ